MCRGRSHIFPTIVRANFSPHGVDRWVCRDTQQFLLSRGGVRVCVYECAVFKGDCQGKPRITVFSSSALFTAYQAYHRRTAFLNQNSATNCLTYQICRSASPAGRLYVYGDIQTGRSQMYGRPAKRVESSEGNKVQGPKAQNESETIRSCFLNDICFPRDTAVLMKE